MSVERVQLPVAVLDALLTVGITADDLADTIKRKWEINVRNHGMDIRVPAREALQVFISNAGRPNGHHSGYMPLTVSTYSQILNDFVYYCEQQCEHLEVKDLPQYAVPFLVSRAEERSYSLATWNKYAATLRTFLLETSDYYDLPLRTLPALKRGKQHLPKALTDAETKNLVEVARQAQYAARALFMINFLLATGLRRDEFRLLRRSDVDLSTGCVRVVGKGQYERVVSLPKRLTNLVTSYFELYGITTPSHYVYCPVGHPERPVSSTTLDDTARRLFEKLPSYRKGDPTHGYHIHSLRHTYALRLLISGVPLRVIAQALGHKSTQTTMIYTQMDPNILREQIEPGLQAIEKMLGGF